MANHPTGLVTLAVLKTRFDEGRDHLALFEPFVADAVAAHPHEHFTSVDIAGAIDARVGLKVPSNTVQTLLGRLSRRDGLRREGGRYFKSADFAPRSDLQSVRSAAEDEQSRLATAFQEYAAESGLQIGSADEALAALAAFIAENKIPLVLQEPLPESPLERSALPVKLTRAVARFIVKRCMDDPGLRAPLDSLVEGMVLRDTLLLGDIANMGRRFDGVLVVLDSSVLFAAIGLTGIANSVAIKEGLSVLRDTGAVTIAFDRTIGEMRRILAVYERHLGSAQGRLSLYRTDLTEHVLRNRMRPSDIREISATIERRLAAVGIPVKEVPAHDVRYTLDEVALAASLASVDTQDHESPRIRHDVDCVAGVMTLRAGRTASSIESCKAIFCTTTGKVIRSVQHWYTSQHERGVPPIVHLLALTNIAWLKRPAAAPSLKAHELAALCAAALRPKRATWDKVIDNVRRLIATGQLSDDEAVAVVASELTEPLLAQLDEDLEPDADTIQEAIDRVRESYRLMAEEAARSAVMVAEAEAQIAKESASQAMATTSSLLAAIDARTDTVARWACGALYTVGILLFLASAALSIPGVFETVPGQYRWAARLVLIACSAFGVAATVKGYTIDSIRAIVHDWLARVVRKYVFGVATERV